VLLIRIRVGAKFTKLHFVTQLVVHLLPDWASLEDPSTLFAQSSFAPLFALWGGVGMCEVGQNLISSYYDAEILQFPQGPLVSLVNCVSAPAPLPFCHQCLATEMENLCGNDFGLLVYRDVHPCNYVCWTTKLCWEGNCKHFFKIKYTFKLSIENIFTFLKKKSKKILW